MKAPVELSDDEVEHLASRASELGDTDVESLCDDALAGLRPSSELVGWINQSDDYKVWMERGSNLGFVSRSEV